MNSSTIRESIQAVVDGLTPLAEKLGVAAESLWGWSIKHTYAVAATNIIEAIVCLLILIILGSILRYFLRKGDSDDKFFAVLICCGLGIIPLLWMIDSIEESTMRLIAPEYYTLKDINKLIRSK